MNIFRGSLNLCFGAIGLRGWTPLRSQLNGYRNFSATDTIRDKNNYKKMNRENDIYMETEGFDVCNEADEDLNYYGKKSEGNRRLMASQEGDYKNRNYGNRSDDDSRSSYGFKRENSFDNSSPNDLKSGSGDGGSDRDVHSGRLASIRERAFTLSDMTYNPALKYLNNILKMSAILPPRSPVLRNSLCKCRSGKDGKFFVQGFHVLWAAFINKVDPISIFYCHQNQIMNLKFNPYVVEYYFVSKSQMLKILNSTDVFAIFSEESVINAAEAKRRSLPLSIVVHNIKNVKILCEAISDGVLFRCQKIISTYGSPRMYGQNVVDQTEGQLFGIPIYDQFRWSEIESTLDPDAEIYLVGPSSSDPSKTRKKSQDLNCVDIFSADFWTKDKILIIQSGVAVEEDEELLKFCKNWNVKKLIWTLTEDFSPPLTGVIGEIQRQHYYKCHNDKEKFKDNESL